MHWVPVNHRVPIANNFRIEESRVRFNDNRVYRISDVKKMAYEVVKYYSAPYASKTTFTDGRTSDYVLSQVTIEVDSHYFEVKRTISTFYDVATSIGGFSESFSGFFAFVVTIWTYTNLENVLVGKFFNKRYDKGLLYKSDRQLGESNKVGKDEKGIMKFGELSSFK